MNTKTQDIKWVSNSSLFAVRVLILTTLFSFLLSVGSVYADQENTSPESNPPEEVKEEEKPMYQIGLTATYRKDKNTSTEFVDVEGVTALPDKALIYIFFKRLESYIATGKALVKNGHFSITFGPFDRQILSGTYSVEADFMPGKQPEDLIKRIRTGKDNKKVELVHGSCALIVEKSEGAELGEEEIRTGMESLVSEVQNLYYELDKTYNEHKGRFEAKAWRRWSENWLLRVKKVRSELQQYSQKGFSLFPDAEESLQSAAGLLLNLHTARSMELEDPEEMAQRARDPKARAGPEALTKCFEDNLDRALKEIKSDKSISH